MAINKVVYGGDTLIDLTSDTVTPPKLKIGAVAHAANGITISGELAGVYYGETEPSGEDTAVWIDPSGDNIEFFRPLDAYPIGSIYQSINSTSPAELFGGSWEQITGRFLLATGTPGANTDNYFGAMSGTQWNAGVGSKGGQDYHTLTQAELPNVTGWATAMYYWGSYASEAVNSAGGAFYAAPPGNEEYVYPTGWAAGQAGRRPGSLNLNFGSNEKHNNMPPYLVVYMWKRIA